MSVVVAVVVIMLLLIHDDGQDHDHWGCHCCDGSRGRGWGYTDVDDDIDSGCAGAISDVCTVDDDHHDYHGSGGGHLRCARKPIKFSICLLSKSFGRLDLQSSSSVCRFM